PRYPSASRPTRCASAAPPPTRPDPRPSSTSRTPTTTSTTRPGFTATNSPRRARDGGHAPPPCSAPGGGAARAAGPHLRPPPPGPTGLPRGDVRHCSAPPPVRSFGTDQEAAVAARDATRARARAAPPAHPSGDERFALIDTALKRGRYAQDHLI